MLTIQKTVSFDAAHFLPRHDGKCRGLHGHTYSVTAIVSGRIINTGPKTGLIMDYHDLGDIMKKHIGVLDHRVLNDIFENPTSELMAVELYKLMAPEVMAESCDRRLVAVRVSETPSSTAEYRP